MKFFIGAFLFGTFAVAAPNVPKKNLQVTKDETALNKEKLVQDKIKALTKEEDCDEKAKKPVEIIPESISLTGNAGCTLDEVKP